MFEINYTTRMEGHTKVDSIEWALPDFRHVLEDDKKEYRIENPKEADTGVSSKFSLKIKLLGYQNDVTEVYFQSSEPFMQLTVSLYRNNQGTVTTNIYNSLQRYKWQYLYKWSKSNIDCNYLRLNFEFKITYFNTKDCFNVSKGQLNNDVEAIFKSSIFSDTIVKSTDGKEFNVHKAILAGRSEVFKANFKHNTIECSSNIVESPFKADVLEEVLKFVYSDMAKVDDMPEELLAAADYYQLYRLKCLCEEGLFKKITKENAIDTLQIAELHSAKTLKQMTLEFIKDDYTKIVFKTEGWSNIKSVPLLKELCEYISSDNSCEIVN